jgi:hypothetical protein
MNLYTKNACYCADVTCSMRFYDIVGYCADVTRSVCLYGVIGYCADVTCSMRFYDIVGYCADVTRSVRLYDVIGMEACQGPVRQDHLSSGIVWLARQYWRASGNATWLAEVGAPLAAGVAAFWSNQATELKPAPGETHRFSLNHVSPPNENAHNVNNSAYTNGGAQLVMQFAVAAADLMNKSDGVPDRWRAMLAARLSAVCFRFTMLRDAISAVTEFMVGVLHSRCGCWDSRCKTLLGDEIPAMHVIQYHASLLSSTFLAHFQYKSF